MRCTHCSSAMTPTHTRRRGRLYRYYVCLGASRRGHDTCPVRSIAASEIEGLVLGQVRRLLASPELVARTITAVRRENGAAEDAVFDEHDAIEALGALDPVWDELYPAEQARILRLLIERIDVAPDGISVTLHAAGIRSLVAELADQEAPALAASEPLLEAQNRNRPSPIDHRPLRAGGRDRRLCLLSPSAHLPCAGYSRGDPGRAAAKVAQAC